MKVEYLRKKRCLRNRYAIISKMKEDRLRVSVFKSCKHVHAQVIDLNGTILFGSSSSSKKCLAKTKLEKAIWVGKDLAQIASNKSSCGKFVYDRGPYRYHGIVKALADSAEASGMGFKNV